jgi:hypothetical protein
MSAPNEPRRLLDADDDALSSHFKHALAEYRELGPSAAAHDRNWRALAGQLSAPPLAAAAGKRPWRAFVAGVGCTVLLGSLAWFVSTRLDARTDRVPLGTKSVSLATNSTLSPARSEADQPAPSVAKDLAAPSASALRARVVASPGPASASATRALPQRRAVSQAVTAAAPTHPAHSELDLLTRARRVVSSAPGRALELASEHARDYPTGAFMQEREVLAIDALQRLGRRAEAVGRAQRFRAAYPTSTYLPRIQAIVDAP